MKRYISTLLLSVVAWSAIQAAPSILDIKHSITDDNVVPPESFETKTRELEQNFYLKNFTARSDNSGASKIGTPKEYEELLSRMPTEIEMPYNSIVGKFIDMYLGKRRGLVADMLALHNYYGKIFVEELTKERLPLELQYLPVIESAINPNAVSRAGAAGLWQFMVSTATGLGMEVNSLIDQRRDPRLSSRYAAKYLKQLHDIYGDWSLAIAAYNCGPGNVNKAIRRAGGGKDFWEIYNYLPKETRGYVPAFIAANFVMTYYDKYGVRPTLVKQQLVTDTVQVNHRVHFNQIADVLKIPIDEIRMLNPQFRKDIIPGDNHPYALVLPSQQCLSYIISEKQILEHDADLYARRTFVEPGQAAEEPQDNGATNERLASQQSMNAETNNAILADVGKDMVVKTHIVGRGENLRDIAKKYGVSANDIKHWNNLRRGKVKEGDKLTIKIVERELAEASTAPVRENPLPAEAKALAERTKEEPTVAKPAQKSAAKPAPKPAQQKSYVVKSGDTLDRIARTNGTTVAAIQKANGMGNKTRINKGQKLIIPSKGSTGKKSTGKKKKH